MTSGIKQKTMWKIPVITKSTITRIGLPLSIDVQFQFSPLHRGNCNRPAHKIQTSKSREWTRPMQRLATILKFALSRSDQSDDATHYQI